MIKARELEINGRHFRMHLFADRYYQLVPITEMNISQLKETNDFLIAQESGLLSNVIMAEGEILVEAESDKWISNLKSQKIIGSALGGGVKVPICFEFALDFSSDGIEELKSDFLSSEFEFQYFGFVPGFAYCSGLPESFELPRRSTPHPRIPAGSIGLITGRLGIYSLPTPGGWNIIGRTPLVMFDEKIGAFNFNKIEFYEIDKFKFEELESRKISVQNWKTIV